jgi:hypothetical protein
MAWLRLMDWVGVFFIPQIVPVGKLGGFNGKTM